MRKFTIVLHEGPRLRDVLERLSADVGEYIKQGWDDGALQVFHVGSTWSAVIELWKYEPLPDELDAERRELERLGAVG